MALRVSTLDTRQCQQHCQLQCQLAMLLPPALCQLRIGVLVRAQEAKSLNPWPIEPKFKGLFRYVGSNHDSDSAKAKPPRFDYHGHGLKVISCGPSELVVLEHVSVE